MLDEMNTATLQNWNMKIETWTNGCKMRFRFGLLHCATKDHNCDLYIYEARRDRPPKLHGCAEHLKIKFKASFNFFMASALNLNTQGSLVKGSMPFFAGVAAFFNFSTIVWATALPSEVWTQLFWALQSSSHYRKRSEPSPCHPQNKPHLCWSTTSCELPTKYSVTLIIRFTKF